jgi:hypothetical protein
MGLDLAYLKKCNVFNATSRSSLSLVVERERRKQDKQIQILSQQTEGDYGMVLSYRGWSPIEK